MTRLNDVLPLFLISSSQRYEPDGSYALLLETDCQLLEGVSIFLSLLKAKTKFPPTVLDIDTDILESFLKLAAAEPEGDQLKSHVRKFLEFLITHEYLSEHSWAALDLMFTDESDVCEDPNE